MYYIIRYIWGLSLVCFLEINAYAQLDSSRLKFIEDLSQDLLKHYLDFKSAKEMTDTIKAKFWNGQYSKAKNIDEFAYEVTLDLRRISKDRHLTIASPQTVFSDADIYQRKLETLTQKQIQSELENTKKKLKEQREAFLEDDYSYGDIKILPGDIGYLKIKNFGNGRREAKNQIKITEVLKFLKRTSSIIIDLRDNSGGSVEQVVKFVSHFSELTNRYLFTTKVYVRYDSSGIQKETVIIKRHYVNSKIAKNSLRDKRLIILVNNRTFSAAESVAYLLKKINPTTKIIGGKTIGAANIYESSINRKYYSAIIPIGKCIDEDQNDFTFEGKGILPDSTIEEDSVYDFAYRLVVDKSGTLKGNIQYFNQETKTDTENDSNPSFSDYVGNYLKAKIFQSGNKLFIDYDEQLKEVMIQISKDLFRSENFTDIKFERNEKGEVMRVDLKHNKNFLETFFRRP